MKFDDERKYYVYIWYIKDTEQVIYVGKGTKYRYRSRKRDNKKLVELLNTYDCDSKIVKGNLTEEEAFELEKKVIAYYKSQLHPLVNVLDGGHMPPNLKGRKHTDEWKREASKRQKQYAIDHPEQMKQKSEDFKLFLQTDEGKDFLNKSLEKRRSPEIREKMRQINIKSHNTDEYRHKMSELTKKYYQTHGDEVRLKGSKNPRAKKIQQYDLEGNLIKEYETLTQASNETGASVSKISAVARGVRKTTKGYVWKFTD